MGPGRWERGTLERRGGGGGDTGGMEGKRGGMVARWDTVDNCLCTQSPTFLVR